MPDLGSGFAPLHGREWKKYREEKRDARATKAQRGAQQMRNNGAQKRNAARNRVTHQSQSQSQSQEPRTKNQSQSQKKKISSEPQAASEPPILIFPTVGMGGKTWGLRPCKVQELSAAFPGVDVLAECRKALAWCEANPAKRKTHKGLAAFLFRWMEKCQNRGGSVGTARRNTQADEDMTLTDEDLR